jgi:hypothetical protein
MVRANRYGWYIPLGPFTCTDPREAILAAKEAKEEAKRERQWLKMMANLKCFRKGKEPGLSKRVLSGIPDSLRGKVWLYRLDPDFKELEKEAATRGEANSTPYHDLRERRYRYYVEMAPPLLSDPDYCTYLPHVKEPAQQQAIRNLVGAYLAADSKNAFNPSLGFLASVLLAYIPPANAFRAYLCLFTNKAHRAHRFFHPKSTNRLCRIWDALLAWKKPKVHAVLAKLEIGPDRYVPEWLQTVFLDVRFQGPLHLLVLDRFFMFGVRAIFGCGIFIVDVCEKRLLTATPEQVLAILQTPGDELEFGDWRAVLRSFNETVVTSEDYVKAAAMASRRSRH